MLQAVFVILFQVLLKIDLTKKEDGEIGTLWRAEDFFSEYCQERWKNVKTWICDGNIGNSHIFLLVLLYLIAEEQELLDILRLLICNNDITEDNITRLQAYFADDFLNAKLDAILKDYQQQQENEREDDIVRSILERVGIDFDTFNTAYLKAMERYQ